MMVEADGNGYVPAHPCLQEPLAITSFETVGHVYPCPPHPHVKTCGDLPLPLVPRRRGPSTDWGQEKTGETSCLSTWPYSIFQPLPQLPCG
jgi:hypothetical protein